MDSLELIYLIDVADGDRGEEDVREWRRRCIDSRHDGRFRELGRLLVDERAGHVHRRQHHEDPQETPAWLPGPEEEYQDVANLNPQAICYVIVVHGGVADLKT